MSLEEKTARLLAWFHASHTIYNVKEVESAASKATGISSMQIKDVLKVLLDEGLVRCEKCGTTNIYWSFAYAAQLQLDDQYTRTQIQLEAANTNSDILDAQLAKLKKTHAGTQWEKLSAENMALETLGVELATQVARLKENSAESVQQRKQKLLKLESGIDVLVDNITLIVNYIHSNNGISKDEIYKALNVPSEI